MACYLSVIIVSVMAAMVTGSMQLFINAMIAIIPMFFSSYAINCYVVGSCHGLVWYVVHIIVGIYILLKLFLEGLIPIDRFSLGKYRSMVILGMSSVCKIYLPSLTSWDDRLLIRI
jgi:hypothetical protein